MEQFHVRQGDVLIERIEKLPAKVKVQKVERIVLAEGEVTGHSHTITADENCRSYLDEKGVMYLDVDEEVEIEHQEHRAITLPPGIYIVKHQREYTPEEIRRVQD